MLCIEQSRLRHRCEPGRQQDPQHIIYVHSCMAGARLP